MGKIIAFYTMPHPPIIIPEVGRGEEKKIKNTYDACARIGGEIAELKPEVIIVVTPHGTMFSDAIALSFESSISGNLKQFGASKVSMNFEIDMDLTGKIMIKARENNIPTVEVSTSFLKKYGREYELDHGSIVPLYFVVDKYNSFKLVHITYGGLSPIQLYKFGKLIKEAIEESDENAVFIGSGDISHHLKDEGPYDYNPYGEVFDAEIISLLTKGDVAGVFNINPEMVENAGECGLRSYYIMLGAMEGNEIKGELLSYEGTFGVGYAVMKFDLKNSNRDILSEITNEKRKKYEERVNKEDVYVRLARESLTHYLIEGNFMGKPNYVTEEMINNKRGVFVSLKKFGQLRGCIGTIFPVTESVASEIMRNAIEAGEGDPRFSNVSEGELEDIVFSVDVLTEPTPALKEQLDPKKYGIIVRSDRKSGLLLPDLAGVNTIEEQISIVLNKASISPNEKYSIEKFEVIRHK
ncbi:AmmeMemoRadiSam system protein A [Clostridium tagluense]|uniref:AmmeMemoRadiSam system protein A n=1 Tax=Clostridium tagluense TaxID=360422 RepID=UPI001C6DEEC4|nr:AmmeMemoRadiSam system protein A [Clostridium tagluense]MBW9157860.1 AmmeMemoRadiSam system protein A [Clostridium tagluense]WLC67880.1 AmmeMemoRadiSam system protein A [Clostridium tagluense]